MIRFLLTVSSVLVLAASSRAATFGANVAGLFPPGQAPPSDLATALQALRATGATVARSDTLWQTAQPKRPVNGAASYDWSYDDAVAGALARAGLRWQPILDYAAVWAANPGGGLNAGVAPAHVGDYAAYAGAFAARYGRGGTFWSQNPALTPLPVSVFEIWNEPDLVQFSGPQPDLDEYGAMYLEARAAIRAVEPTAKVVIGGLVFPRQTLIALIADHPEMRGNVDGIAVHPYRATLTSTMQSVAYDLETDAATFGVPLYVNEYDWWEPWLDAPSDTDAIRYADLEEATAELGSDPYIADVEPYCWRCGFPFDIYGTSAVSAFADGIAAATRSLQRVPASHHKRGAHARASSEPRREANLGVKGRKPTKHRRKARRLHQRTGEVARSAARR
jgi:hypothetical protein